MGWYGQRAGLWMRSGDLSEVGVGRCGKQAEVWWRKGNLRAVWLVSVGSRRAGRGLRGWERGNLGACAAGLSSRQVANGGGVACERV